MAQQIDLNNLEDIRQIVNDIESDENRKRRKKDFKAFEVYSGNQQDYVKDELRALFPSSHESMRVSNVNVLRKVVDKKSKVYKEAPTRKVDGEDSEELDDIYKAGKFNRSFQSIDTLFNRHKHALAWVQNKPEFPTEFKLKSLAPYVYDLVVDPDTNEVLIVILSYPSTEITHDVPRALADTQNQVIAESQEDSGPDEEKVYAMWSKDFNVNIKAQFTKGAVTEVTYISDDANPLNINSIGRLPFVWITSDWDSPDYPTPSSLPNDSVFINVLNSDLLTASSLQGFGTLLVKYPQGSRVDALFTGFNVALELPQSTEQDAPETTAEYINANPDLSGMKDTVMDYAASILSDNGLEGASLASKNQNFTSGFDRLLASASVSEIREENSQLYSDLESGIFDIIKAYDTANKTSLFKTEDVLTVVYTKPTIIISEVDKLAIIEKREDLGLNEPHEKFIQDNPELTEDLAKEKEKRIIASRTKVIDKAFQNLKE